jgi:hypothetical protein
MIMKQPAPESGSELVLYQTEDGQTRIECRFEDETIWLSLNQMAELFQTTKQNISLHIQNIFKEGELQRGATVKESLTVQSAGKLQTPATIRKFRIVQLEGARSVEREVDFYNLDVIISVGYRVKSARGTQFRIWATQRLREYLVKGFTMDDERLKNPPGKGHKDYFDELLERIIWWIYTSVLLSCPWQATLGMKVCGLKITDESGKRISFGRATGRYFASFLSVCPTLGIGFLMIAWTSRKQGLHDLIARTLVVKCDR